MTRKKVGHIATKRHQLHKATSPPPDFQMRDEEQLQFPNLSLRKKISHVELYEQYPLKSCRENYLIKKRVSSPSPLP